MALTDAAPPPVIDDAEIPDSTVDAEPPSAAMLGELRDGVFSAYADEDRATWVWGFQGGTMIQPVIGVPSDRAREGDMVTVRITHRADPRYPSMAGEIAEFVMLESMELLRAEHGMLVVGPLADQIGWGDPSGTRVIVEASLHGASVEADARASLELVTAEPTICQELELTGTGCMFRWVPGTARVLRQAPTESDGGCADPQDLTVEFQPTDPATLECFTPTSEITVFVDGLRPGLACLTGLGVGSTFGMRYGYAIAGTCAPRMFEFDLPCSCR